ncbi:MFS transporter [Kitasatospora terrestris]|uniref:MFS transporter n=1 Tax=Kitasatospora terrestris TaxID=258051 RepID=A0ABP9EJM0_9ACTN
MKSGRIRVLAAFLSFGTFWGAWGALVPDLQRQSRVGDGELGVAILMIGFGALCSMRPAGRAVDRWGRPAVTGCVAAMAVAGFLPALATSGTVLVVALMATGAASGAMDVAVNALAAAEEVRSGPIMSAAHACFSAAVVVGAVSSGAILGHGASLRGLLGIVATVVLGTAALVHALGHDDRPPRTPGGRRRTPWTRSLVLLGVFCALAYLVENAWQSWAAVLLRSAFSSSPQAAALGPALFAAAAAAGRLLNHRLLAGTAERSVLIGGALVGAAGTFAAAVAPTAPLTLLGVVVAGLGTSVCAPVILSLAGRVGAVDQRASAISIVTTLGYSGFLVGPAAVGLTAAATGLRTALACVGLVAVALAVLGAVVRPGPAPAPSSPPDLRPTPGGGASAQVEAGADAAARTWTTGRGGRRVPHHQDPPE